MVIINMALGNYGGGQQQRGDYSLFDSVKSYLFAGYYQQALYVLSTIQDKCNGIITVLLLTPARNKITALNHAKTTVQMEPNNPKYQRVLIKYNTKDRLTNNKASNLVCR